MFTIRMLLVVGMWAALAACTPDSDDGGGSASGADASVSYRLNGTTAIPNATVQAHVWNGGPGRLLKETQTDQDGDFSLSLEHGTVLVSVSSGVYTEPASGIDIENQYGLTTLVKKDAFPSDQVSVAVTPVTNLIEGLATYYADMDNEAPVAKAYKQINAFAGFDVAGTVPQDTGSISGSREGSHRHGFFEAGMSHLTFWLSGQTHGMANTLVLSEQAQNDLRFDGVLDGKARNRSYQANGDLQNAAIYRHELAKNILVAASSDKNKTDYTTSDLYDFASSVNTAAVEIFDDQEIIPLDSDAPTITNLSHSDDDVISGSITLSARITDRVGVQSSSLYIDGNLHSRFGGATNPEFVIDTTTLSDAPHIFRLEAKSNTRGTANKALDLVVNNSGPSAFNLSPNDQYVRGTREFSADVTPSVGSSLSEVSFLVDNQKIIPESFSEPSISVDTTELSNGSHQYSVQVTDSTGKTDEESAVFEVDNADPSISWNLSGKDYLSGNSQLSFSATDNINLQSVKVFIDGSIIDSFESGFSDLSTIIDTTAYPEGLHTITVQATDHIGNIQARDKEVEFLNSATGLELTNPLDGDVITSSFQLSASLEDPDEIDGDVEFWIAGERYSSELPALNVTSEININNYPDGDYTFVVKTVNKAGIESTDSADVTLDQN